jgi:error-prone DNA polymerase
VGALASLGLNRRQALWQAAEVGARRGPLLEALPAGEGSPLPEMSPVEETVADYEGRHLTTGPHLMAHLRPALDAAGVTPIATLKRLGNGAPVRTAGAVITRQRPGTAGGTVFLTVEDETGMVQAIIHRELFREQRALITSIPVLIVEGTLQRRDGSLSVRARRLHPVDAPAAVTSHDFH